MDKGHIRAAQYRLRCLLDSQYELSMELQDRYAGATEAAMTAYRALDAAFGVAILRETELIVELERRNHENTSV